MSVCVCVSVCVCQGMRECVYVFCVCLRACASVWLSGCAFAGVCVCDWFSVFMIGFVSLFVRVCFFLCFICSYI